MMDNRATTSILVVDDHEAFRRGIVEFINDQPDMRVVAEARDGAQAVRIARELGSAKIDVVLMDVDMPVLSGIRATEAIAQQFPHLPIVMLTVSSLESDLFGAIRAGAVGYLTKNLAPEAIARSLRSFQEHGALPISPAMAMKVLEFFRASDQKGTTLTVTDAELTDRELEVLELIAAGLRDREIAARFVVTESTVKKHVQNILRKLHARNRTEAAAALQQRGTR